MNRLVQKFLMILAIPLAVAGCRGIPTPGERRAREDARAIEKVYRPDQKHPDIATLNTNATLEDFLRFAMLNHPRVEAAYYDWRASVERITVDRSLPDPQLTFETYFADAVTSLMPGLMLNLPGPGKLGARANVAIAESQARYETFAATVLETAFAVKKTYYPLQLLSKKIRVNRQTLELLANLESLARVQNEVGKATLQDVLRAQIEQEKLRNEIINLEDSHHLLMAQFKAALGLSVGEPDPSLPETVQFTRAQSSDEELLAAALAHNPRLKQMEAELKVAEAGIKLARRENIPDFSAGFEVDVKPSPVIWNPQFSMSLPVWRDKVAAEIASAQNARRAASARLTAEQISLGVDYMERTHMIREADRGLALLREKLLPRARQTLEVSRAAYRGGQVDFLNVIEAERASLDFQLDEIAGQTQREVALGELSLVIAGLPPAGAPLLDRKQADLKPKR